MDLTEVLLGNMVNLCLFLYNSFYLCRKLTIYLILYVYCSVIAMLLVSLYNMYNKSSNHSIQFNGYASFASKQNKHAGADKQTYIKIPP